ncbi:glutathione S-transferase theta-1 isoform X4 [Callithrix jacchus]|uniref:glutathione S-transferase theta-1 isoform X4 n=1 Tax=Callithrix jacchus TaxID=9483 RepID=UPI00159D114F|nr:glutathione S-transferase theta-1 isoform X4 [Callithrix jacchus]
MDLRPLPACYSSSPWCLEKQTSILPPHQSSDCCVAILLYLTHKYKVPDHWYPQDLQARARVDEYLAWQHTTLRRSCLRALWHKVMFPVFLGEPVSPQTLAATLAELDVNVQLLEDKFLQNKAFLAGPHISLADLVAITELMHPVGAGCQVFEGRPKLAAWRNRVEAAVGEDLFREAHEIILKAKDFPPADPTTKQKLMSRWERYPQPRFPGRGGERADVPLIGPKFS